MALKNAKFLYNIFTQAIRTRSSDINTFRQYSGSKGGKDPCKPKDTCPPKEKGAKADPCAKDPCPKPDPCKKADPGKKADPCAPKKAAPKDPCKTPKDTKSSCTPKPPAKPADPCAKKTPPKDPCKKASEPKSPCVSKSAEKPAAACPPPCCPPPCCPPPCCPPPCCPPPCCPPPPSCGDEEKKPICSPAIDGKVAVITGASVGIGYYCALAILKNGGKVMLGDVKVDEGKEAICKIIDKFGYNKAAFIKCDVTVPKDMECLFNAALSEFNQIDIVVNNAGILMDKLWEKTIDINVKGVIKGTFLGFQHMRRNKCGGMIVNMASILGHQPFHGCPVYCGTKHFVVGFSRSMGHDYFYKQTGVKVMTMCPGVTVTSMTEDSEKHPQLEGFGNTAKVLHEELFKLPTQSGEACGMHLVTILEGNENGSDWISEGGEVYRVKRVDRKTLRIC